MPDFRPEEDVVRLCSDLIRTDTSIGGPGERDAAELVAAELSDMGLTPVLLEQQARRSNVLARIPGRDQHRPALLVQMHLDVVPADASGWSVPPFAGEVRNGSVWGRGAVDMKDMIAMVLTALRSKLRTGWTPERDIVIALVADEEMGGRLGAGWLVEHHAEHLEGCTEAIGEAGGFSYTTPAGQRAFFVQVAEKGIAWLRLVATGAGGHGSLIHENNPINTLAEAVRRIDNGAAVVRQAASTAPLVTAAQQWSGLADPDEALRALGPLSRLFRPTIRNTYNTTTLTAGLQHNVVPAHAEAAIDGRYVPGFDAEFFEEIRRAVGDLVDVEVVFTNHAVETTFDGAVPEAIVSALRKEDNRAVVVPVCLPIGTDAKHFSRLGIRCYGFAPLLLPDGYDFAAMFHGIDERVPISALQWGVRVLDTFLGKC